MTGDVRPPWLLFFLCSEILARPRLGRLASNLIVSYACACFGTKTHGS